MKVGTLHNETKITEQINQEPDEKEPDDTIHDSVIDIHRLYDEIENINHTM